MRNLFSSKIAGPLLGLFLCSQATVALAQIDKHIDQSANKHKHTLSIGKHVNSAFTHAKAKSAFAYGTKILQTCDNRVNDNQDVAVAVTVEPGATLGTFGTATDGLDIINTQAELDLVMNNASFYIKVVKDMPGSGTTLCNGTPPLLGCGGGSSIVMVEGLSDAEWGEVVIHEFGHNQGLGHRDAPGKPIMHTSTLGNTEVNDTEAAAFHKGGTDDGPNRPIRVSFVVDDTGSMSEEIDGVKNGILAALNFTSLLLGNSCDYVYQLTSFKDNVTARDPTTDLSKIQTQVGGLFAAGGGDCPEASVEAVDAIKDKVKDGGYIYLFTDASPHPGLDIAGLANALKARKVTVSILLSGDCGRSFFTTETGAKSQIPYSDNRDPDYKGEDAGDLIGATLPSNPSAIEAYSFLAQETGGIFAFVPDVNSYDPEQRKRFENIISNLVAGAVAPSVINAEPGKGPQGGTLVLTITGSNTAFNNTTVVSFSNPGIVVNSVTPLSATQLQVNITIGGGVPLGYYDISTTTMVSGIEVKTEGGKGLLQVIAPPTDPTILSISPQTGETGQTLTVKITGINTHFTNASVIDLGPGITVSNVTALSDIELQADLTIDPTADIGFRDVTVTTGSEFADEDVAGPFLVTAVPIDEPTTWYRDFDKDGFGDPKRPVEAASAPEGYVSNKLDCNDFRVTYEDVDNDGWGSNVKVPCGIITRTGDCNDNNPKVHTARTYYRDADGDSWGNAAIPLVVCENIAPSGYVANKLDCDDTDKAKRSMMTFYADSDKDGYGNPASPLVVCASAPPAGYVHNKLDCNDSNPLIRTCPATTLVSSAPKGAAGRTVDAFTLTAHPNPFTRSTRIQYTVPVQATVSIRMFDVLGREVGLVFNGERQAGTYVAEYNTKQLTSGVYYCRLVATTGDQTITQSQKMVKVD